MQYSPEHARPDAQPAELLATVQATGLLWHDGRQPPLDDEAALRACAEALTAGRVVVVRTGGTPRLVCDAGSAAAVTAIRERKGTPARPVSVMIGPAGEDGLDGVRAAARVTAAQGRRLLAPDRPIVLLSRREVADICEEVAPGLDEVGVRLAAHPLYRRLCGLVERPLVVTTGPVNGDPLLCERQDERQRRDAIASLFQQMQARPAPAPQEPVYRQVAGAVRPLRLGHGREPLSLRLPFRLRKPLLAMGTRLRNTVALGWDRQAILASHPGDLVSEQDSRLYRELIAELQQRTGVAAEALVCDAHPEFSNSRSARNSSLEVREVFHHHAHASAIYGEFGLSDSILCVCWDGAGYGHDGTLWGGETFLGQPGGWRRVASLRPYRLPSADDDLAEGHHLAQALCWESGVDAMAGDSAEVEHRHRAWLNGIGAPWCSSAGRLFEAAAAMVGALPAASYDGHGPLVLEALARRTGRGEALPLARLGGGPDGEVERIDWAPLVPLLLDEAVPAPERARAFHLSLAAALTAQLAELAERHRVSAVGLAGGVFQNRLLTESLAESLGRAGLEVHLPERLPVNDGAVAFGQLVEASAVTPGEPRRS